jgi:RNA-directed DNA polymerase
MPQYQIKDSLTLPQINSVDQLANLLSVNSKVLYHISNNSSSWYKSFQIPKRNGSTRTITAPLPYLKKIQSNIAKYILNLFTLPKCATAFIPKRNIRKNASFHINKAAILNCDIADFFPSLKSIAIYHFFKTATNYPKDVCTMLTKLCTIDNHLPQGAPTSPVLSNLLLMEVDYTLNSFAKANNLTYSRYADDLTFSGDIDNTIKTIILNTVKSTLGSYQLKLNTNKTKFYKDNRRQLVTGLVVNEKVNIPRENLRKLRTYIHYVELDISKGTFIYNEEEFTHYLGLLNFYCSIKLSNKTLMKWHSRLLKIQKKYKKTNL